METLFYLTTVVGLFASDRITCDIAVYSERANGRKVFPALLF